MKMTALIKTRIIKKSQKTPQNELKTALARLGNYKRGKL